MSDHATRECLYVQLLNEGTVVFRPVEVEEVGTNTVRLLQPEDYDPEDEEWEFLPGTVVVWEMREFPDGPARVAVAEAR